MNPTTMRCGNPNCGLPRDAGEFYCAVHAHIDRVRARALGAATPYSGAC